MVKIVYSINIKTAINIAVFCIIYIKEVIYMGCLLACLIIILLLILILVKSIKGM